MSGVSHPFHRPMFVALVLGFILACLVALSIVFVLLWVIIARSRSTTSRSSLGRSAAVVVLGDVGRSPRMCYHAQSLAEDGWRVAVVGYPGTPPPPPLRRSSVKHHHIARPGESLLQWLPRTGKIFTLVAAPIKLIGQSASLFWALAGQVKPPPELIIVQSPPALPALFIVRLVGLLLGSKVIIDWHNLGYSILAMRFPPTSHVVRLAKMLERWTGRKAFAHLCVTQALKQHLEQVWRIKGPVRVLYDRPPSHFRRAMPVESHKLLCNLTPRLQPSLDDWLPPYIPPTRSPFTEEDGHFRADRPALVVTSTSWTADEDFSMLLKAASLYEMKARELYNRTEAVAATPRLNNRPDSPTLLESPSPFSYDEEERRFSMKIASFGSGRDKSRRASVSSMLPEAEQLPKMLLIVTGKGELQQQYLREIARLEREEAWQWVRIRTAWLPAEEYPVLLGSADVGVSLHSSSSGMDLPMKVVDMLGCGTPVCALGFPCIGELVQHGKNGLVFYNAQELATQLESLLGKHPDPIWLATKMSTMDSLFPSASSSRPVRDSPTTKQRYGQSDLASESSRASSPPPSPLLARPSSPLPTFTLLASPTFAPSDFGTGGGGRGGGGSASGGVVPPSNARHWSANWKKVVRPLLEEADELEETKEKIAKLEARHSSNSWSMFWRLRGRGLAKTMMKKRDSIRSTLSTPRSSHESSREGVDGAGASGVPNQYKDNSILPRSSPRQLRQRVTNRSWTGTSSQEGIGILSSGNEKIPGIEISPAEATS